MAEAKVLIIDDDPHIAFAFRKTLESQRYQTLSASSAENGLELMASEQPDLVFMDITMPGMDGLQALNEMRQRQWDIPVVIITGFGTMETAIRAVRLGAYDYMPKPLDVEKVRTVAQRAIETRQLRREVKDLQARLQSNAQTSAIVGDDPGMQEVYKSIGITSGTPNHITVLIQGETGTGKELVAREIHNNGPCAAEPFVAINCTAVPEELLENELFGSEPGAFTGARSRHIGRFEAAANGSIFLDEIGDLPLNFQSKLLRVLQERSYERLGSNEPIEVNARFIAATHRDLKAEIEAGRFREDLYFRIAVVPIALPPLRQRKGDIPKLVEHFLDKHSAKLQIRRKILSEEALKKLLRYDWPGNLRELEHLIERCLIEERGEIILPEIITALLPRTDGEDPVAIESPLLGEARRAALDRFERRFVIETLEHTGGNVSEAARRAGIRRQSFQRLMNRHGISSSAFRPTAHGNS